MSNIDFSKLIRLKNDLHFYSHNCLKIKTKNDGLMPLTFTTVQLDAHRRIEQRKRETKPCKIAFLKARQVGFSTYTEARFFHKLMFQKAKNAFVLADKEKSTQNIFEMTKRYYDNVPDPLKLSTTKLSSDIMAFETDSSFRVGTAGSKSIGRSMTINYFHGSEVAFWPNADSIVSGMLQTVPDSLESEIILESTANGTSGDGAFFFNIVQAGLDPLSDYLTLFYPWFAHPEYRREVSEPLKLDDEEIFLQKTYGLSDAQLAWRRSKILTDFKGREQLFKQEYPSSIQEAFITSSNALVGLKYIELARKNFLNCSYMPIVIGVDPARDRDRTVICVRQGRVILKFYRFEKMDNNRLAGILTKLIQAYNPAKVFIDFAKGDGVFDILTANGLGSKLELVNFGESALNDKKYTNKRAEMFDCLRDWFMQPGGVFIQDQEHIEEFVRDIYLIPDLKISDSNGRYSLESKAKIVSGTDITSTDYADAAALTFASPVAVDVGEAHIIQPVKVINRSWQHRR